METLTTYLHDMIARGYDLAQSLMSSAPQVLELAQGINDGVVTQAEAAQNVLSLANWLHYLGLQIAQYLQNVELVIK